MSLRAVLEEYEAQKVDSGDTPWRYEGDRGVADPFLNNGNNILVAR
jgi:hypothetical protein